MKSPTIKPLIPEADIRRRVGELARALSEECGGRPLLVIGVLEGARRFATDIARALDGVAELDWTRVSSYGAGTRPNGQVVEILAPQTPVEGRDVLLVEDIVDSGRTLAHLTRRLLAMRPASLRTCTLLDKPSRREAPVAPDYAGFRVPDQFVVGYGMDWAGKFRELPFIGAVEGLDDLVI